MKNLELTYFFRKLFHILRVGDKVNGTLMEGESYCGTLVEMTPDAYYVRGTYQDHAIFGITKEYDREIRVPKQHIKKMELL